MCIVIGKYFPNYGWIAIKNRDRNYIPEISFKKVIQNNLEILYFYDHITDYCEGFNSNGIGVLSSSLMVLDDEKEVEKRSKKPSKDGLKIKRALSFHSIKDVITSLITDKLPGNTLIFNQNNMFILEGCWSPGGYKKRDYQYKIQKVPENKFIVRTNHGISLPWAGYQLNNKVDNSQKKSRISSEARKLIAEFVTNYSSSPKDILDGLTTNFSKNPQLNALRTSTENKKMRTTSQILIIPKEKTMYVRPVQSNIVFDFWKLNNPNQKTWVELLSNRILYNNLKLNSSLKKLPLKYKLHHNNK